MPNLFGNIANLTGLVGSGANILGASSGVSSTIGTVGNVSQILGGLASTIGNPSKPTIPFSAGSLQSLFPTKVKEQIKGVIQNINPNSPIVTALNNPTATTGDIITAMTQAGIPVNITTNGVSASNGISTNNYVSTEQLVKNIQNNPNSMANNTTTSLTSQLKDSKINPDFGDYATGGIVGLIEGLLNTAKNDSNVNEVTANATDSVIMAYLKKHWLKFVGLIVVVVAVGVGIKKLFFSKRNIRKRF